MGGGVRVVFLLADAWFFPKAMPRSKEELSLTAIVRMKKSKLKYRLTSCKNNKEVESRHPKEQNHAHSYIPSLKLAVP
jgi:hypothetical protein